MSEPPSTISLRALESQLYEQLNTLKTTLIRTKLDFLYNFLAEEAALEAFAQLKDELEDLTQQIMKVQKQILNVTHNKVQKQTVKEKSAAMELELSKMYAEVTRQDIASINTINRTVGELAKERRQAKYNLCAIIDDNTDKTLFVEKIGEETTNKPISSSTNLADVKRLVLEPYTFAQMHPTKKL
jgi:hypothetical protein